MFDKNADTIIQGFGLTEDRLKEIVVPMQGKTIMEGIELILTDETLQQAERYLALFHLGSDFGQYILRLQASAAVAQQAQQDAMNAVMPDGGTVH